MWFNNMRRRLDYPYANVRPHLNMLSIINFKELPEVLSIEGFGQQGEKERHCTIPNIYILLTNNHLNQSH